VDWTTNPLVAGVEMMRLGAVASYHLSELEYALAAVATSRSWLAEESSASVAWFPEAVPVVTSDPAREAVRALFGTDHLASQLLAPVSGPLLVNSSLFAGGAAVES
jgi:hypothetical protein